MTENTTGRRPTFVAWATLIGLAGLLLICLDSPLATGGRLVGAVTLLALAAAEYLFERAASGRAVAVLELIMAIVGLSVSIGYSVSHLLEQSFPAAMIGILSTVAWLIALSVVAGRAFRVTDWPRRIVGLMLTLPVLQLAVLPIAAGTSGAHAPRIPVAAPRPAAALEASFSVAPGVDLHGWYTASQNGAALVLLPGADGNRGDTTGHAAILAAHGYGVLAIDARGSGDSGGIGNLWGWTALEDISGAINWLAEQPGVDPQRIGLVGLSMGGEEALTVAPLDHRVAAVVSEGVQGRVAADTWFVGDEPLALIERSVDTLTWLVADLWSDVAPPAPLREVVDAIGSTPVLLIAADAPDERAVAADIVARAPSVTVWQTNGIGHTQALALAPGEWEQRVVGFLDGSL